MKSGVTKALAVSTILLSPLMFSAAAQAQTFEEALKASTPQFNINLRYEGVDQDGIDESAAALTYRIRAGLETGAYKDTKFLIDFDYTEALNDEYAPQTGGFPVVADPEVVELNRFQLTNTSMPDTKVTLGRQRIIHPGARFIGNVGWRQDEQTFDALRVENTSIENVKIDVSYIQRVNRIFGDGSSSSAGTAPAYDSESWIAQASSSFKVGESASFNVSGFAYLLDLENAGLSTETYGIEGGFKQGLFALKGTFATQGDYGDNPIDYSANYYLVEGSVAKDGLSAALGFEVLGSDDGALLGDTQISRGFVTPLATLHAYNGWADKFLGTPAAGLEDMYVKGGYKTGPLGEFAPITFTAVYHTYSANEGGSDYGSEIDFAAATKVKNVGLLLKYANYSADDFATDTRKIWLQANYSF